MNTKFEQDFSLLPKGQFTPSPLLKVRGTETRRALVSVVVAMLALAAIGLSAWYFWPQNTLLARLPADASFYASFTLSEDARWYDKLFIWRRYGLPPEGALALYQQLANSSQLWQGLDLSELIRASRGRAEAGKLADGTWILSARLKDSGAWPGPAGKPGSWYWQKAGGRVYLSRSADFWEKIKIKPASALGKLNRGLGKGLASFYFKDASALPEWGIQGAAATVAALRFPFMAAAKTSGNNIIWREIGRKNGLSSPTLDKLFPIGSIANAGLVWQFADLGQILTRALSNISEENKELLGKFYNVNLSGLATKLIGKQGMFILSDVSGPNWLLLIRDSNSSPDQDILSIFKGMATAFFAATHPQTVEHTLADGSKMVELRAEPAGIEGKAFTWRRNDADYDFWGLFGQGENTGYFVGFLPSYGYALMTSSDLLDVLLFLSSNKDFSPNDQAACSPSRKTASQAWLRPALAGAPSFLADSIKFIGLNEDTGGQLSGCFIF